LTHYLDACSRIGQGQNHECLRGICARVPELSSRDQEIPLTGNLRISLGNPAGILFQPLITAPLLCNEFMREKKMEARGRKQKACFLK
jgi:hypothetical protein